MINHLKHRERELDRLLRENIEEIKKLKELIKDVISEENDDVWLLRYILSNKNAKDAEVNDNFFSILMHDGSVEMYY